MSLTVISLALRSTALALVLMLCLPVAARAAEPRPSITATIERTSGPSRVATAIALSRGAFPEGASAVVVARADAYPDALAGAPLAAALEAPVLLSGSAALDAEVADEITRLHPEQIVLLGGESALSPTLADDAAALAPQVRRLAGSSRYGTSAAIASEVLQRTGGSGAYLTAGAGPDPSRGWPDAVAISGLAALEGRPILLTGADELPRETREALDGTVTEVTIVGGTAAVSVGVESVVASLGTQVDRVAGATRYLTSLAVARRGLLGAATAAAVTWVATGAAFPDALATAPAVAASGGTLVLVDGLSVDGAEIVAGWLEEVAPQVGRLQIVGGEQAVTEAVQQRLAEALTSRMVASAVPAPPAVVSPPENEAQEAPVAAAPAPLTLDVPAVAAATPPAGPAPRACVGASVPPDADLQTAIDRAGDGSTVCVGAGVHRITAPVVPRPGQSIIGEPGAVLSGARVLTDFRRVPDGWSIDGQDQRFERHGYCDADRPACDRAEDVFLDHQPLTQVLDRSQLRPGTFFFDYEASQIILADDPTDHLVEASVAPAAIYGATSDWQPVDGVTVAGLVVEKFATRAQRGAIDTLDGDGWIIEDNVVRLNHGAGVNANRGVVRRNAVLDNGQLGIGGSGGTGLLVEANEIAGNNHEGYVVGWEGGGGKWTHTTDLIVRGNVVRGNHGVGLWSDIDSVDSSYLGNHVADNTDAGIFIEISYGAVIEGNTVVRNGFSRQDWVYGAGIQIAHSPRVLVTENVVEDNAHAISVIQQERGEGAHGPYLVEDVLVSRNRIVITRGSVGLSQDVGDRRVFTDREVRFEENRYELAGDREAVFTWMDRMVSFDEWQTLGNDPRGEAISG